MIKDKYLGMDISHYLRKKKTLMHNMKLFEMKFFIRAKF